MKFLPIIFSLFLLQPLIAQESLRIRKELDAELANNADILHLSAIYHKLAKAYLSEKDYQNTKNAFEKELELRRKLPDTAMLIQDKSKAFFNVIALGRQLGDYRPMQLLAEEALAYNQKYIGKKSLETADSYKQLAELALLLHHPDDFKKYFSAAIDIRKAQSTPDTLKLAELYILQSGAFVEFGDYFNAELQLFEAKKLLENAFKKDEVLLARLYTSIGAIIQYSGRYADALNYAKKALEIRLKNGEKQLGVAWSYHNLAVHYYQMKHYKESLPYYRKSVEIFTELLGDKHPKTLESMTHLAESLIELKSYEEAEKLLKHIITIKDNSTYRLALRQLAGIEENLGHIAKSEQILKSVETILLKIYPIAHPDLAEFYRDFGNFYKRINQNKKAIDCFNKSINANVLNGKIANSRLYLKSFSDLLVLTDRVEDEQILKCFDLAGAIIAKCSKDADLQAILAEIRQFYESLLYQQFNSKINKEIVFHCFEASKSLFLSSALKEKDLFKIAEVPFELQKKYNDFKNSAIYYEQLWLNYEFNNDSLNAERYRNLAESTEKNLLLIKSEIEKKYPLINKTGNVGFSYEQALKTIDEKELFLCYFTGEKHNYMLALTKNNFQFKLLEKDILPDLISLLQQFYYPDLLENDISKSFNIFKEKSNLLAAALLPKNEILNTVDKICIIPDGFLYYLPFELLPYLKTQETKNFLNFPYLIKRFPIRYAYSFDVLAKQQQKIKNKHKTIFAAFAPLYNFETEEHLPLPAAMMELEALKNSYSGSFHAGRPILKNKFLTAVSQNPELLHLAMHAYAPDTSEAYLLLSGQDKLFMHEIMKLNLDKTALVVLSACQTGLGGLSKGEGLMSLGRAFAYAGVKSVMTTSWPLHDKSAVVLMSSFYAYLEKGYKKSEALRLAKLDFISNSGEMQAHPMFWAAAIIWGNDEPLLIKKKTFKFYYYLAPILISILLLLRFLRFRLKK
jgi:CHAT domain-containing protein